MKIEREKVKFFDASRLKVGIVVLRFNNEITDRLLESALATLKDYSVKDKNIHVVSVAGSVETPFALQKLAKSKKYHCLVALGAVIKGETDHYTYVCKMAQEGVLRVMLDYSIPIGFGILMTETPEQAKARAGSGGSAVSAVLELTNIKV